MRSTFLFVLPWAAIGVALAVVAAGAATGKNVFKKQGVAWLITIVMVIAAVGIGYANAPFNGPVSEPAAQPSSAPPASGSFVWDDANALSARTIRELDERNDRLWDRYSVSIGVVTCNYGRDDLDEYAMQCAEDMGLGGYDMIVTLDISGENYWLIQGNDIRRDFTDDDCSDYAYECMEFSFAREDYDDAVLELTKALEDWYGDYYR